MTNREIQKSIDNLNKKINEIKKNNTVDSSLPKMTKKFTYRKTTIIKSNDVGMI